MWCDVRGSSSNGWACRARPFFLSYGIVWAMMCPPARRPSFGLSALANRNVVGPFIIHSFWEKTFARLAHGDVYDTMRLSKSQDEHIIAMWRSKSQDEHIIAMWRSKSHDEHITMGMHAPGRVKGHAPGLLTGHCLRRKLA
jgi:hypothetical protein